MQLTPETRKENFLARAAGNPGAEKLTPITREEHFLEDIVEAVETGVTPGSVVDATAAMTPEQAAQTRQNIGADTPETVTEWLEAHVDPDTGYVIDDTLTIQGAAADAKATGDAVGELKSATTNILNEKKGTTGEVNTWVIVSYSVFAGKDYVIYNYSDTATISLRTMATPDGANIDIPTSIGPNNTVTFTASANANYLRVISTGANTPWGIEEKGTRLLTDEENIEKLQIEKLNAVVYKNEKTETCAISNVVYYFPFPIKSGKTYLCTAKTAGNTMAFRTSLTDGGAVIDSLNGVVYGGAKSFTATADANYIIAISYLANGEFTIQEEGTIDFELNGLYPVPPVVNLPTKLYAVTGKELNIYFDNIVENSQLYTYNIVCTKGKQMQRGFSITPVDDDAGNYDFTLNVIDKDGNIIVTKNSSLIISAELAGTGTTKTIILLGDSTVQKTDAEIINDFADDSMNVTTLGTRGTAPALHEGREGWTFQYYYNSASISGITNPFYNPDNSVKKFDANYYFTNSGVNKPDLFFIQLGINDVFSVTDDSTLNTTINTMISQCDYMIASIQSASPNTKIGIAITIPPNYSQDAFGKAYGCGQTRDRYKRNNLTWVSRVIDKYSDKENNNVYLIPIFTNLDTIYNMGLETMPVNARNTAITYESPIANGGVHPVESGYKQLADVYMAFLKAQASV